MEIRRGHGRSPTPRPNFFHTKILTNNRLAPPEFTTVLFLKHLINISFRTYCPILVIFGRRRYYWVVAMDTVVVSTTVCGGSSVTISSWLLWRRLTTVSGDSSVTISNTVVGSGLPSTNICPSWKCKQSTALHYEAISQGSYGITVVGVGTTTGVVPRRGPRVRLP